MLKSGQIGGVSYSNVAYVGFSIGSVAGVSLASQYPDAVDAVILHGYSWNVDNLYPGYLAGLQSPVNQLEKPEWRNISSLYQSQSTPQARQAVVFYGDFDPNIVPVDFGLRDMDALGLALSFGYHLVPAPNFTGPVFLGDGNRESHLSPHINVKSQSTSAYYSRQRILLSAILCVAHSPMQHTIISRLPPISTSTSTMSPVTVFTCIAAPSSCRMTALLSSSVMGCEELLMSKRRSKADFARVA